MTFEELYSAMAKGNELTPQDCEGYIEQLVGMQCMMDTELEGLEMQRAEYFGKHREEHKSDKSCTNAWEMSADGKRMMLLRGKLKRLAWVKSALKSRLKIKELEAKNIF